MSYFFQKITRNRAAAGGFAPTIGGHGTLQKYRGTGARYFAKISSKYRGTGTFKLKVPRYFFKKLKEKNWTDWPRLRDCKLSLLAIRFVSATRAHCLDLQFVLQKVCSRIVNSCSISITTIVSSKY